MTYLAMLAMTAVAWLFGAGTTLMLHSCFGGPL